MLSVCDLVQGTLSSVWQIPFAAPAGGWGWGGVTTILSLWFREGWLLISKTIQHPNMPSAEFPLGIYIQGKECKWKKLLFFAPPQKKKKGNLKALWESWPVGALQPDTFVQPPREGAGRRGPVPAQTLPWGAGPHGKGGRRDRCGSTPSISSCPRVPSPSPLTSPPLYINRPSATRNRVENAAHTWRLVRDSLQTGSSGKRSEEVSNDSLPRDAVGCVEKARQGDATLT